MCVHALAFTEPSMHSHHYVSVPSLPCSPPLTLVTRAPMYGKQARDNTLYYRRSRVLIAAYALFCIVYRIVGQRPGYASQPRSFRMRTNTCWVILCVTSFP